MHHGILGMKWGVRKAKSTGSLSQKLDSRYKKGLKKNEEYLNKKAKQSINKANGDKNKAVLNNTLKSIGVSAVSGASLGFVSSLVSSSNEDLGKAILAGNTGLQIGLISLMADENEAIRNYKN
jgi:hypothetical protein